MGLLDFIEEHNGEGFLADSVRQLAAHVGADVAGRRADEPLVCVLGGELRHVKADVSSGIAKE